MNNNNNNNNNINLKNKIYGGNARMRHVQLFCLKCYVVVSYVYSYFT